MRPVAPDSRLQRRIATNSKSCLRTVLEYIERAYFLLATLVAGALHGGIAP
jgi:hypothetical protein